MFSSSKQETGGYLMPFLTRTGRQNSSYDFFYPFPLSTQNAVSFCRKKIFDKEMCVWFRGESLRLPFALSSRN